MLVEHLESINDLADKCHPSYPEDAIILEEKLSLFPFGCFVLHSMEAGVVGYCFSHPWNRGTAPSLNRPLTKIPTNPNTYFFHDIAIRDQNRGGGHVGRIVAIATMVARLWRVHHLSLVAVNRSENIWRHFGFADTPDEALQATIREKYSDEAIHMQKVISPHFDG